MKDHEIRVLTVGKIEIRAAADNKPPVMAGYAAKFNSSSEDLGGFTEYCMPGCFSRSIREAQDVRCLVNHDDRCVLGRTKSQTLRLKEDATGLGIECDLPDTSYSRDLQESLKRGDIDQMSFSFHCLRDNWRMIEGKALRELVDLDLYDVSPVTFPAYSDTSVMLTRSLEIARRRFAEFQAQPGARLATRRARVFLAGA